MRICLLAPFELIFTTTGLFRLVTFSAFIVGFFVALSTLCYKIVALIGGQLDLPFFDDGSSWIQLVGYVLNFTLLYRVFVFYYFVFCTFLISFIITFCVDLMSRVVPEAVDIFRATLRHLTGD